MSGGIERDRHVPDRLTVDFKPKRRIGKEEKAKMFNKAVEYMEKAAANPALCKQAIEIFEQMPGSSLSQYNIGLCKLMQGDKTGAAEAFQKALKLKKWDAEGVNNPQTERNCINLLADGPKTEAQIDLIYNEACNLMDNQQFGEAEILFKKLPQHGMTEYNLGLCCRRQGKNDEALDHFSNTLSWAGADTPQKVDIQNNARFTIGEIGLENYKNTQDPSCLEGAEQVLMHCTEPKSGFVCELLGRIADSQGKYPEAVAWFSQAHKAEWPGVEGAELSGVKRSLKKKIGELEAISILAKGRSSTSSGTDGTPHSQL